MKYYRIVHSLLQKEIGFFPQVHDFIAAYEICQNKNSSYFLNFTLGDSNTLWPIPILSKKAKKTDMLSTSISGISMQLLISNKFHNILSNFSLDNIQFFKPELIFKKEKSEYFFVNPTNNAINFLDFSKTKFCYMDIMLSKEIREVNFNTYESCSKAFEENRKNAIEIGYPNFTPLVIKNISLKQNINIDFFSLTGLWKTGISYYVSENLKVEIERNKLTGITFKELNGF